MNEPAGGIPVVAVVGPTASGKTKLAAWLARRYHGEVVSADSMQIYKGLAIGTAQPTEEEKMGVPHHLIGVLEPWQPFSVADYVRLAGECIRGIRARGRLPVLAGGTGLYVDSLLNGLSFGETVRDDALRADLARVAREQGGDALLTRLAARDPETAASLHPNNTGRIIRAIEVCETSGMTMAELRRRSRSVPSPYRALKLGLAFADRQRLYARIDARVDAMFAAGLEEEARALLADERLKNSTALQAIGYKELAGFFAGACTRDGAAEDIKRATRRYAKRQLTWFRRDGSIHWIDAGLANFEIICEHAAAVLDKWTGL